MKPLFILFTALTLFLQAGNFLIWAEADEAAGSREVSQFRGKESEHNCGDCHEVIAEQYARSSHSASYSNPFYQKLIEKLPKEKILRCNRCHLPRPLFFNGRVPKLSATGRTVIKDGIGCTTCHQTKDSVMLGPFDAVESPHMSRNSKLFTQSATCAVCHGEGEFDLVKSWKDGGFSDTECIECHMPQTSGKAVQHFSFINLPDRDIGNHLFPASNSLEMVERSVAVDVAATKGGLRLVITNSGAGHLVPGGRYRAFRLTVWRQNENGIEKEIFTARISKDRRNRLPPGGSLSFQVKIKKGAKARVQLEYLNLLSQNSTEGLVVFNERYE